MVDFIGYQLASTLYGVAVHYRFVSYPTIAGNSVGKLGGDKWGVVRYRNGDSRTLIEVIVIMSRHRDTKIYRRS